MLDIVGFVFTFYVAMFGCLWISYGGDSRENVNLRKDGKTKIFFPGENGKTFWYLIRVQENNNISIE